MFQDLVEMEFIWEYQQFTSVKFEKLESLALKVQS